MLLDRYERDFPVDHDVWDQLEDETNDWYEHFTRFRMLGPGRTVRRYYRILREQSPVVAKAIGMKNLTEKATHFQWVDRALAWDQFQFDLAEERARETFQRGLALKSERILELEDLADMVKTRLIDPKSGKLSPFLVEQYRGILDDIAKEVGDRVKENKITNNTGVLIETQWGRGGSANKSWIEAPQIKEPESDK